MRTALRSLKAQPGFAALVIVALGLGIGANCALFTVLNSLVLRPLPYQNPEELVELLLPPKRPLLEDLMQARSFAGVAAYLPWGFSLSDATGVRNIYGSRISANLFAVLGVQAAVGRIFSPDEDDQPVVMLSYEYWRRISGGPQIVGQTITLSGQTYTVVGVLPASFWLWVRDSNLFVPSLRSEGRIVARLKPGVTRAQAQAELEGIVGPPEAGARSRLVQVVPSSEMFRNNDAGTVLLLQATVGLVLLITCANVANLLLVRSIGRRREFAIRAALGAGRAQLVRQLLTESAVLAALGGALGVLFAHWSLGWVQGALPANISRRLRGAEALSIDGPVLAFTAGVSLVTVLLFGMAPAVSTMRFDVMSTLRDSAKGLTPSRQKLGQLLVIGEVALALMLLIGAGLMLKSLVGLQNAYLGFSADHVLRGTVDLLPARYPRPEQRTSVFGEIVRRLESLPGVETVGVLAPQLYPFGGPRVRGALFSIRDRPDVEARAEVYVASPSYFRSVRIPLLRGRTFTEADTATSAPVALISEVVARRYWGQDDPIGRVIRLNAEQPDSPWVTVIGVVGDVRNPVALDVQPTAYRPLAQRPVSGAVLMIRTTGDPMALAAAVQRGLRAIDPTAPDFRPVDLQRSVRNYVAPRRFMTSVIGSFAFVGLLLAAVGVYGVMRCWVSARIPEIGMRVALGAGRRHVLRLVLGKAARASLIGIALGAGGALALRRVIASQLYGVSATDPSVFIAVSLLMSGVALGAALFPALRAAKVDPIVALRQE